MVQLCKTLVTQNRLIPQVHTCNSSLFPSICLQNPNWIMISATVGSEVFLRGKTGSCQKPRALASRGNAAIVVCDSNGIAPKGKTAERGQRSPKPRSNRTSPTTFGHYAGPKFSEPPEAALLPPPPPRWTFQPVHGPESFDHASHQLKLLLNVHA